MWSVLFYESETWTLKIDIINKIGAFQMSLYRNMLNVPWTSRTINVEALRRTGQQQVLLNTVKNRKLEYLKHIIRGPGYEFFQLILSVKIEGKK